MTTIGDIFDIPERVHQGDFVLRLTEGLSAEHRSRTLRDYIVTPQLADCFDRALSLVGSALESRSSKGAYLHGSFGSGKSHFMAVLDMLLDGEPDARSIPALAPAVAKASKWWQGQKFLLVPYHMIGAESMESAILGGYARHIRERHPDAPTPGFYRSASLLKDARQLRDAMGEDAFFAKLGGDGDDDGWGDIGSGWDATSFEAAAAASPEDAEHQRLVGDLIDAYFGNARDNSQGYLDLDRGLAVMAQHAKALGYAGIVLFLDELVLWLASRSADRAFLSTEGQKVAKLVESGDASRPIPIISFIARQRDLRDLVGDGMPGAEQLAFNDILRWWEARFDEIVLEDRNLPEIIKGRLLRTKNGAADQELQESFTKTASIRREVLDILLTREGDKQSFEKVYPFSPALVQTLVAISNLLQRERTALKLMLQLLIQNRDRLALGDVIPVGDLFDVILEGSEPFTQATKLMFDRARDIWERKFLPMLEETHQVGSEDVAAGRVDEAVAKRFRADAGLLKTLLLSALAPQVESLSSLTPARMAALNHGTIRSPLPNGEGQTVMTKMRDWAGRVGEIHVSDAATPIISMQLAGVDVEGILENARGSDNAGNRVRVVKEMILRELEIDPDASGMLDPTYEWVWRGMRCTAELSVRNVRTCTIEHLKPTQDGWRIVIDFPFDEDTYGPKDDRAKVQELREHDSQLRTLIWLPSFFNERALHDLGRLVVLNHVLSGQRLEEYGSHLQPAERAEARNILTNMRDQLHQRIKNFLRQAYGIAQVSGAAVDTTHQLDEHFETMFVGFRVQPPPGGGFKESVEHLLDQAMGFQFPGHPRFEAEIRKPAVKRVWAVLQEALVAPDGRVALERATRDEVKRIVAPLRLAQCGEAHLVLTEDWRNHFERKLAEKGVTTPSVAQLRAWLNEPQAMGLSDFLADLVILTWAGQSGRVFVLHGASANPDVGELHRDMELKTQALPDEADWATCLDRVAELFGLAPSRQRNAASVASLLESLQKRVDELHDPMRSHLDRLRVRSQQMGLGQSDRLETAQACVTLLNAMSGLADQQLVGIVAHAKLATSATSMGHVMARARELVSLLDSSQWDVFARLAGTGEAADALLSVLKDTLDRDEHVSPLKPVLDAQYQAALRLLVPPKPEPRQPELPPPPAESSRAGTRKLSRRGASLGDAQRSFEEAARALQADDHLRADIEISIYPVDDGSDG